MYEELIQDLRDKAEFLRKASRYSSTHNSFAETMSQAADTIEEEDMAFRHLERDYKALCAYLPKWIPATERLPDAFKHVLVNIPGMTPHPTVQEAFLEKNGMWYSNGFRYYAEEITHWMPLPQPPVEGI